MLLLLRASGEARWGKYSYQGWLLPSELGITPLFLGKRSENPMHAARALAAR